MTKISVPYMVAALAPLVFGPGCTTRIPDSIDGAPVTLAERQAIQKVNRHFHLDDPLDAARIVRETMAERASLTGQIDEAKAYNEKLAAVCAELLNEVDDLKGRPHATLDQKKDLLKQIQRQTERASSASKQTDAALEKSLQVRASLVSSGKGRGELKAYDAEIGKLEARKRELAKAIRDLSRQRSEISS